MKKIKKIFNEAKSFFLSKKFSYTYMYIIFPIIITLMTDIYFKLNDVNGWNLHQSFKQMIENGSLKPFLLICFLIAIVNLLIITITNSFKKSMLILCAFFMILLPINDIKFQIMGEPIKISDINFLNSDNTDTMIDAVDTLKGNWMIKTFVKTCVCIVIIGILFLLAKKTNCEQIKYNNLRTRIISLSIFLIITLILIFPMKSIRLFIFNKIYDDNKKMDYKRATTNATMYIQYGFIPGMYYNFLSDYIFEPDNYNKEDIEKIIEETKIEVDSKWGDPNVVFILSESFWDISILEEFEYNIELTENINKLKENNRCIPFKMLTPSYGGATVNVEFEILTGGSICYFNNGYIPYLQLYKNNKKTQNIPNLIKEFNNAGYETKYITASGRNSYNSEEVYNIIGIDKKIYKDDFIEPLKRGGGISDKYMIDVLLEELKKSDNKQFIFMATGQNHMPYKSLGYLKYDVNIKKSKMENFNSQVKVYAQGVYDADKELGRLYKEIQNINEPTIVIFFGDHLPYILNNKGENLIDTVSYFNTEDENINYIRKHTTQGIIISNFDIKNDENMDIMNASYIGSYVLDKLNIETSTYFKYINKIREFLPAYSKNFVVYGDEIKLFSELSEDELKIYKEKEKIQYRYFIDNE